MRPEGAGTQYAEFEDVDPQLTVSKFKARWAAQEELNVRPSRVTLRLVACGARKPSAAEEAAAAELDDPSLTLAAAGVTGTAWMLAKVAGACNLRVALLPAHVLSVSVSAAQLIRACCTVPLQNMLAPVSEQSMLKDVVKEVATLLLTSLAPLVSESRRLRLRHLDPWRNSNRSDLEQAEFKTKLLRFYECAAPHEAPAMPMARCMVSNQVFPQPVVIASHIWKYCTDGSGLDEFGLRLTDLHSPRNGLLMASEIEAAFDTKRVAFSFNLLKDEFTFHVLDSRLLETPIIDIHTKKTAHSMMGYITKPSAIPLFKDLDNRQMTWAPKARPFRRLLAWHYAVATMTAARHASWHTPESPQRPAPVDGTAVWINSQSPDATWPSKDVLDLFDHAVSRSERDADEQQEEHDADDAAADDGEARGGP